MDERYHEMAQEREERQRQQAIDEHREREQVRFRPYMIEGVPHCPECLEPLPAHRLEAGICVRCLSEREQRERVNGY